MTPGTTAGLCATCRHAERIVSASGSAFLLCGRSRTDSRFRKYPPLPVLRCAGHEMRRGDPGSPGAAARPHRRGPDR